MFMKTNARLHGSLRKTMEDAQSQVRITRLINSNVVQPALIVISPNGAYKKAFQIVQHICCSVLNNLDSNFKTDVIPNDWANGGMVKAD